MMRALESRIKGISVTTSDGVVCVSIGDVTVMLDSHDVKALSNVLRVADHLVERGY